MCDDLRSPGNDFGIPYKRISRVGKIVSGPASEICIFRESSIVLSGAAEYLFTLIPRQGGTCRTGRSFPIDLVILIHVRVIEDGTQTRYCRQDKQRVEAMNLMVKYCDQFISQSKNFCKKFLGIVY